MGDASSPSVSYLVELTSSSGTTTGRLEGSHLSDHPASAEALRAVLKPGSKIGELWEWGANIMVSLRDLNGKNRAYDSRIFKISAFCSISDFTLI